MITWTPQTPNDELPEGVREAVERAKDQITIAEAEALRLRQLADSSEHAANEAHKRKIELDEEILRDETFVGKIKEDISALETTLNVMRVEQADLQSDLVKHAEEKEKLIVDIHELARQKTLSDAEILSKEEELKTKLGDFNSADTLLKEKVEKIATFLESIR